MRNILLILTIFMTNQAMAFDHQYSHWNLILKKYLRVEAKQTLFNYQELSKNPKILNDTLREFSELKKEEFDQFTKPQRLAFLINSYNAFTIKLILNHYPVDSIKDIGSFFSSPWKKRFFTLFGKKTHLDQIEHDYIRKNFDEPRIHFAVVCASLGCPPLATQAYTDKNLDKLLEEQAILFITDQNENRLTKKRLYLSKIFKWYGDDFKNKYQSYLHFVAKRIVQDKSIQQRIISGDIPSSWNNYDWKLNN